jgi:hypothetical protein
MEERLLDLWAERRAMLASLLDQLAPEDALIIEGWAAYDPDLEGIAVFATNITTKLLQAVKRQQQTPSGSAEHGTQR